MGQWKHFRWYTRPKCFSEATLCCFLLQTDETEVLWAFPVKSCPLGLLMKGLPVGGRSEQPFDLSLLRIPDYLRWIQETFQWCLGCIGNRRPSGNNSQSALQSFSCATRENSIFPCCISSRPGSSFLKLVVDATILSSWDDRTLRKFHTVIFWLTVWPKIMIRIGVDNTSVPIQRPVVFIHWDGLRVEQFLQVSPHRCWHLFQAISN